ncbi:MAG: hypothetical protein LBV69_10845 [Bacteroidales bacterium]|jgi:hypothetical protein|nr:hypothetical protein [Bacteroidales bacterium]
MKKVIFFAVIAMFCFTTCEKEKVNSDNNKLSVSYPIDVSFTKIAQGDCNGSEGFEKEVIRILDSLHYNNMKNIMDWGNVINFANDENINFNEDMLLAVFDTIRMNGGWTIDITNITETETSLVVTIENFNTGDLTQTLSQPFEIVKLPKSNKNLVINFNTNNNIKIPYFPHENLLGSWYETYPTDSGSIVIFTNSSITQTFFTYTIGYDSIYNYLYEVIDSDNIFIKRTWISDSLRSFTISKVIFHNSDSITINKFYENEATVYPPNFNPITLKKLSL